MLVAMVTAPGWPLAAMIAASSASCFPFNKRNEIPAAARAAGRVSSLFSMVREAIKAGDRLPWIRTTSATIACHLFSASERYRVGSSCRRQGRRNGIATIGKR